MHPYRHIRAEARARYFCRFTDDDPLVSCFLLHGSVLFLSPPFSTCFVAALLGWRSDLVRICTSRSSP